MTKTEPMTTADPTVEENRREKHFLLQQMLDQPERDWIDEGRRVVVLHESIAAQTSAEPAN